MPMKLIQYKGPFSAGQRLTFPAQQGCKYVHLGVQIPQKYPISNWTDSVYPADFYIEDNETNSGEVQYFAINKKGILEFENIGKDSLVLRFAKDLPMEAMIEMAYTKLED